MTGSPSPLPIMGGGGHLAAYWTKVMHRSAWIFAARSGQTIHVFPHNKARQST